MEVQHLHWNEVYIWTSAIVILWLSKKKFEVRKSIPEHLKALIGRAAFLKVSFLGR